MLFIKGLVILIRTMTRYLLSKAVKDTYDRMVGFTFFISTFLRAILYNTVVPLALDIK